ncbi:MAG: MerR family transcriptional regulator, partial [Microthrixaceae bacterium]
LNLAGVKRVLELEAEVERINAELDALRARAAEDVDKVHRQYRRDLVPLSQAMVLYRDDRRRR